MSCAVGDLVELKTGPRWLPDSKAPKRLGIIIKVVCTPNDHPYDILYYVSWLPPYSSFNENTLSVSAYLIPRAATVWYAHEIKKVGTTPDPIDL
jgi:hypothetical protein